MSAADDTPFESSVDPMLAQAFASWSNAGHWVAAWDDQWRYIGMSDEMWASGAELVIGEFRFGPANTELVLNGKAGGNSLDEQRGWLVRCGGWLLADIQLADLDTATEKARRDAPAIAVCDIRS